MFYFEKKEESVKIWSKLFKIFTETIKKLILHPIKKLKLLRIIESYIFRTLSRRFKIFTTHIKY